MILKHDITVIYFVLFCVPFLFKPFYLFIADGSDSSGSTVPPSQHILGTFFLGGLLIVTIVTPELGQCYFSFSFPN